MLFIVIDIFNSFWKDKKTDQKWVREAKEIGHLSTSQRQAIIKLTEKKGKDKRFIKNWWPISLLNVDSKIISKAISEKLKEVLPDLISSQQTTYVKNRHIGESGRLVSDVIEITETRNIKGF